MKGEVCDADDKPLDTVAVNIENLDTHATRSTKTDGNGFFGAVDLQPGPYRAQAGASYFCFNVVPGLVADTLAPSTVAALQPSAPNNQLFTVSAGGTGADAASLTGNSAEWAEALTVEASRCGNDRDGRL